MATTAGAGLGPIAAGALTTYAPRPTTLCYLAEIVLLVAVAVVGVPALPPAPTPRIRYRPRRPAIPAAGRDVFIRAALHSALTWAVVYVLLALAPAYIATLTHTDNLLITAGPAGLLLLVAAVTQLLCGTLTPQVALRRIGHPARRRARPDSPRRTALGTPAAHRSHRPRYRPRPDVHGSPAPSHRHRSPQRAGQRRRRFFSITYLGGSIPVITVGLLATALPLTTAVPLFAAAIALALLTALATP